MSPVTDGSQLSKFFSKYPYLGLIPKADKFMFNDGAHRDMVNIFGTIPVPYKVRTSMNNEHSLQLKFFDIQGQSYNIPVSVWILDSHPYHAPVCFVKPTADMQIKVRLCYVICAIIYTSI